MFTSNTNRNLISVLLALVFLLHAGKQIDIPLLNKIENIVYDLRLKLTLPNTVDDRIIIIDIDEKSLAAEGRWPWSRDKISFLLDMLFDYYQINVVGFDIVFSEPDTSSGLELLDRLANTDLSDNTQFQQILSNKRQELDFDDLLSKSLENRSIVLGYYFNTSNENNNPDSKLPLAVHKASDYPQFKARHAIGYGANLAQLQTAAIYGGYFNNDAVDSDGSFRRIPMLMEYKDHLFETLSLAIYRRFLDNPPLNLEFDDRYSDGKRLEHLEIESLSIPVNEQGIALVPYRGKQGSFKYVSATDILNGTVDISVLQNKITIVGATAAGILDLRTTPVQHIYPGVEVHANLISGMLDQSFKSKPSFMIGAELLELILLAIFVMVLYPRLSSTQAVLMLFILIAAILGSNIYFWQYKQLDSFLAAPLLMLFALFSIQIYFSYFIETKKKNKLGKIFGQYIPEELVAEMSHSEKEYELKSESKNMTVLFSDVRGFTSISEQISPEDLSQLMNDILTPITGVIHHNKGTIDKYIGDAIMAFWGAPIDDDNHAEHAVTAAMNFIPELNKINHAFAAKGWPEINMGIGLNSGKMSVGNMGSEFRMSYTVMGDAVNLGSRLEGLTKQYGVSIIVGETTKDAADTFSYIELDRVRVKGKNEPVTIYEPIAKTSDLTPQQQAFIDATSKAMDLYLNQEWTQAKLKFELLQQQNPDRMLFSVYLQRIENYISTPPSSDWDGVYSYTSK